MIEKSPQERILEAVFRTPTKGLSFTDIAREAGLAVATVAKHAKALEGYVRLDERPNATYVRGNHDSEGYVQLKRVSNLRRLYEVGLVSALEKAFRSEAIVLFGSYGKGEDFEESDIDIAIVQGKRSGFDRTPFEKPLGREINILHITYRKTTETFLNVLANGTILTGHLDVKHGLQQVRRARKGEARKSGSHHGRKADGQRHK